VSGKSGRGRRPKMKAHPAGHGKPGVPYRPIFPPKPDGGKWYWSYEGEAWVDKDPYADKGKGNG
jgi:hypothetical protein